MRLRASLAVVVLAMLASGCAAPPKALRGEFSALRPGTATEADVSAPVRWGGRILEVQPERDRSCFEILSLPLGPNARPDTDASYGRRFLACRPDFVDPAAYPEERLLTVTGELTAFERREIGEYAYRYPVVQIRASHLWPRVRPREAPYPRPMSPWWYDPYPWGHAPYSDPRFRN